MKEDDQQRQLMSVVRLLDPEAANYPAFAEAFVKRLKRAQWDLVAQLGVPETEPDKLILWELED